MVFGLTNATVTKYYPASSLTKDIHGSPQLASPTTLTHRVWFEESSGEQRAVGGDTFTRTPKVIGALYPSLEEGDIIEITPDQVGDEEEPEVKKWRITSLFKPSSSTRRNSRIRRMELSVAIFEE